MQFRHSFRVRAPQPVVADFHSSSGSMGAITPPPVIVRIHSAPERLSEGDRMDFTLWLGLLPIHWVAVVEQTTPVSFVDRQISGPFAAWRHLHTYIADGADSTLVIDEVSAQLSNNWWWKLVGLGMWINLPILFAYRGWKTRRLLESSSRQGAAKAMQP